MRARINRAVLAVAIALPASSGAQTSNLGAKLIQEQKYCYGLSALANLSVLQRNAGKSYDDQMGRRQESLGMGSPEYKMVEGITKQIYDKDLRDPIEVIVSTHRSCLQTAGIAKYYAEQAIQACPVVGALVAEVSAARRRGATVEQVVSLVGTRYAGLEKSYEGGIEKLAGKYSESSKPNDGSDDHMLCMLAGMALAK